MNDTKDIDALLSLTVKLCALRGWNVGIVEEGIGKENISPVTLQVQDQTSKKWEKMLVSFCDLDLCKPLVIVKGYIRNHTTDVYLHVDVAKRVFGEIPEGYTVDHINKNPFDNTRPNLRLATKKGQMINRQHEGTCVELHNSKYRAYISIDGKKTILGTFEDEEDAKQCYKDYRAKIEEESLLDGTYIFPPMYEHIRRRLVIDLPTGQVSYMLNFPDLFDTLPIYSGKIESIDVDERSRRVTAWKTPSILNTSLPDYERYRICNKCGYDGDHQSLYCKGESETKCFLEHGISGEHLHRTCVRCRYVSLERCVEDE